MKSTQKQKQAFIFTLDALLVLPLLILIISSLISFSSTLRENILLHEYSYMIAKDSISYLSELEVNSASIPGLTVGSTEGTLSILEYVARHISSTYDTDLAIKGALNNSIPEFAGYIFEYKNSAGSWVELSRGGNAAKLSPGNYSFQVSATKILSSLSDPVAPHDLCGEDLICSAPVSVYIKGEIVGPIMFRIRVFV